jgi:autotransporter-associated beta strand protein
MPRLVRPVLICFALLVSAWSARAQDGFCMVNGATTGGTGGTVVTVTNGTDFNTQINIAGPRIVQVQGVLSIGRIFTTANKTIIGLGTNATLLGNINVSGVTNVIIRNLRITAPANDGLTIWNAQHVWIDHCTFYDTGDGLCDMNNGSQYVTLSWCKFHYVNQVEHRFTMIADGYTNTTTGVTTYGYYTLHHNWWSTRCDQRQTSSSYGRVHYYNNFWNCTNDYYASLARADTEILSQSNYYSGVNNPLYTNGADGGKIQSSGNIYSGCTGTISPGTDSVFTPPYAYTLDAAATVPTNLMANAGAPGPDTMSIPPKIWIGGGSGNNLNTTGNWSLSEIPKDDDILVFAGNTRLAPNNNLTAGTEFYGITFSNTAGAFVLGGNALDIGGPITDDSTAAQTINFNMDFEFGQFHYTTNRYINVSSPSGSLVINGNVAGNTNAYFNSYCLTKQGPGLLTLNGLDVFVASLQLDGGLVQFKTLDTNQPGSLGYGTMINFNGGGLRWATNNSADISARTVTISTNGATFDVGTNNVTFASRIGNSGVGGLTKLGAGTMTFNATNNYRGNTLIAQGVLALGSNGLLTNSPQIILSNNAVLDVSVRSDGTQLLPAGKFLFGNGTVRVSVTAANGSTIAPGFSIGTLVITNVLTFQSGSTNIMELDANLHTNDVITGMTSVSYGGKLIVTNLNGSPQAGDSFKLFSAGSFNNSFSSITLPTLTGNLIWTNKLAVDGTIAVVSPVNTAPTNITFAVTGNQLQLSWPVDYIGWTLQVQTNSTATGLGTNWFIVPGSQATNRVFIPIDSQNGCVLLRLVYQ